MHELLSVDYLLTALIWISFLTLVLGVVSLISFRKTSTVDQSAKRHLTVILSIVIAHAAILDIVLVVIRAILRYSGG